MIKKGKAFLKLKDQLENMKDNGQTSINLDDLLALMDQISYEEFQKRMKGKEVAFALSDFVNSMANSDEQAKFVEAVLCEHRTLQQSMFRLFMECIKGWAALYERDWYDTRNEATCRLSHQIAEMIKDEPIPFI